MAVNNISLQQYLSVRPPRLDAIKLSNDDRNTTNEAYGPANITAIGNWADFNYNRMLTDFGPLLQTAMIGSIPSMPDHPQPVSAEVGLRSAFDVYLKERIRTGLRFALQPNNQPAGYHYDSLDFGVGKLAQCPAKFEPDTAFYERGPDTKDAILQRKNRCPGDFKPSYKWARNYVNNTNVRLNREGRQVLSQLNKYMNDNNTRYGYILTDAHMVAVRKMNRNGSLELSSAIPWRVGDNHTPFGALIALWYLGMLAARRDHWNDQNAPAGGPPASQNAKKGNPKDGSEKTDSSKGKRDGYTGASKPSRGATTGATGVTGQRHGANTQVTTTIAHRHKTHERTQAKEPVVGRKKDNK